MGSSKRLYSSMVAVITKVSYQEVDYETIDEWEQEMREWKEGLIKEFATRYEGANPNVLVISQDLTKTKRMENKIGTKQNELMLTEMQKIYDNALNRSKE